MIDPHPIRKRFISLCPHLSERARRLYAATEARAAGYGGIAAMSATTGIAVSTIGRGLKELTAPSCSGLHLSAVGRDLIGLNRLTLAGIIGCVWLTLGDPGRTIGATGMPLSAPAHACWD